MNDLHDSRLLWRGNPALMWLNRPLRHPVLQDGRLIEENIVGYICRMKRDHPELLIGEHQGIGKRFALAFDYARQEVRDFRQGDPMLRQSLEGGPMRTSARRSPSRALRLARRR